MPRTMLQLRIDALRHYLEEAEEPSVWKQTLELPKFNVDDVLWGLAVEKIHTEAGELRERLERLDAELANGLPEAEGWRRYLRVQTASDEIFHECLDLLERQIGARVFFLHIVHGVTTTLPKIWRSWMSRSPSAACSSGSTLSTTGLILPCWIMVISAARSSS